MSSETKVRIHSIWVGGSTGYRYSIIHDGKLLVERSRDPACDSARALLANGVSGKLTMLDGKTGRPRYTLNIEKMAKLTTKEGPLRFEKLKQSIPNEARSREEDVSGSQAA